MKRVIFPLLFVTVTQLFAHQANAAVTIRIFEDGSDVAVTWSGNFNTNSTTFFAAGSANFDGVRPNTGQIFMVQGNVDYYYVSSSALPTLGPGVDRTPWDTSNGDAIFLSFGPGDRPILGLPPGYSSGSSLSGSARVNNTTLSAMGLTPGTYTLSSTNGGVTDSVSIVIEGSAASATATPVPTLPVFGLALLAAAIAALGRRAIRR